MFPFCCSSSLESLPGDVIEAVSSLVFAASKCGELPELNSMLRVLRKYFGYLFETANEELLKGNLVNSKMKQNLCTRSVSDDQKLRLVKEISEEHNLQLGIQDFGQYLSTVSKSINGSNGSNQVKQKAVQKGKVLFEDCRSLDSSIDKLKRQNGRCSNSTHVHPKLPDYEDVRAKLTHVKLVLFKDCRSLDSVLNASTGTEG